MTRRADDEVLAAGARAAAGRGEWDEAFAAFADADARSSLAAEDLRAWATAAYLLGRVDTALDAEARAHRLALDGGDVRSAARSAFWVAFALLGRGDVSQANGWLARCARLVASLPADAVERGYDLVADAFRLAAVEQRWADAHAVAVRAVDLGRGAADDDLVCLALNLAGRSLLATGRADEGMALLDEAMVAIVAASPSPIVAGTVYCSLIEACEEIADWRRAAEWTAALTRWADRQRGLVTFTGQCLTHQAHVLRLRGELTAAAAAARSAGERFAGAADEVLAGAALYEVAEVHRVRGDIAAAEEGYRRAADLGYDPQPGLALLRLAQGRLDAAVASLRRLDAEGSGPAARIRLLPAYVEALLAAGDLAAAGRAADELAALAVTYRTVALRASADGARGAVQLAEGRPEPALADLRRAVEGWRKVDAPYEAARARMLLARACATLGDADTAALERDAARRALARLGASVTVAEAVVAGAARDPLLSPRERQVLRLVATGATNQAIAEDLHLAVKTVDRHVANILAKLGVASRTAATAFAYEHGLLPTSGDG